MRNNKIIFLFFLLHLTWLNAHSQNDQVSLQGKPASRNSLDLYISGGFGYYPSSEGTPAYLQPKVSRINAVTTVRVFWQPNHLLKMGLETGTMTFYNYELTDSAGNKGRIALKATPVLLEFGMTVKKRIRIIAGTGVYFLNTKLDYAGETSSQKLTMGWMAAASYTYPLTRDLGLGAEAKWLYASETTIGSLGIQLQLVWKFFKW